MSAPAITTTCDLPVLRRRLAAQLRSAEGIAKAFARKGDDYAVKDWSDRVSGLRAELAQADHELTQRGVVLAGWLNTRDLPWVATIVLCFAAMGLAEVLG